MKILFINEYTAMRGGVDTMLGYQVDGLKKNGIDAEVFSIDHREILSSSKINSLKYFNNSIQFKKFNLYIEEYRPDILHFHNIYPLWGFPFWSKLTNPKIKTIQHLHNYYPFCLNSFFYTKNRICFECYSNNSWLPGIKNKCYNNSFFNSIVAAIQKPKAKNWLAYSKKVNLFIGVSDFIVDKYIEFGIGKDKIIKLDNAVLPISSDYFIEGDYILYLGNVVEPKGVTIVCKLAKEIPNIKFIIAGDGKNLHSLRNKFGNLHNLKFIGYVDTAKKNDLIKNSRFIIFPTLVWESFGLVIMEAFQFGKPVLTTGLGATSNLVKHLQTGIIVKNHSLENIKKATITLWNELKETNNYRHNCLQEVKKYSIDKHINQLKKIYNNLLNDN